MQTKPKQLALLFAWTIIVFAALTYPIKFEGGPVEEMTYADKFVHFVLFFIFVLFLGNYLRTGRKLSAAAITAVSILAGLFFAGLGEWWQTFLPYRTASTFDFIFGSGGAIVAGYFVYARFK